MPESQKKQDILDLSGERKEENIKEGEDKREIDIPGRREIDKLKNELLLLKTQNEGNILKQNEGLVNILQNSIIQMHGELTELRTEFIKLKQKIEEFMEKGMWEGV